MSRKLCACLLNVSEARTSGIVEQIAGAVTKGSTTVPQDKCAAEPLQATVLNIFSDYDYNRSVITIAASTENIGASVLRACAKACELIDLRHHCGYHPRLGAVDLVPIHPLTGNLTMEECGDIAKTLAAQFVSTIPGTSAFLFGWADPEHRGLVQRRKDVQWYTGQQTTDYTKHGYDIGSTPSARYGITGIGAIPYVMNCNVTIKTDDLVLGGSIAKSLRATTPGGLPGVQSMAFPHEGNVEIACNVESIDCSNVEPHENMVCAYGRYYYTPGEEIEDRVRMLAKEAGVDTLGRALVGFRPEQAAELAEQALDTNQSEFWRTRNQRMM